MSTEGGTKAVVAALLANTGIAVMKFLAFLLTGASSMLAEGIHSVADSGNQLLLLLGGKRSEREATPEHPFGFGRERYIYSFLVAIVLFSVGGLFALYEAYHKWHEVHDGQPNELLEGRWWWVAVVVLLGAIVMESLSFRTAIRESNRTRGSVSWVHYIRRAKSPELPVILLEDFAALIGLGLALLGVGLSKLTGNGYFDVAGTAGIGLLLVAVAAVLGIETKSLLLGEAASPEAQRRLRDSLLATPGRRAGDPHADHAPRPGGAAGGGEDRRRRGHPRRRRGPQHRRRRAGDARGRADRPGDLRGARRVRRGPPARPASRATRRRRPLTAPAPSADPSPTWQVDRVSPYSVTARHGAVPRARREPRPIDPSAAAPTRGEHAE